MRTTLDLPDPLFRQAKKLARERGIPFKVVVADGLRLLLQAQTKAEPYRLPNTSFKGNGLVKGLSWSDWDRIRELAYEGHGG